ncbi:MAG: PorP/SprF family type IX secretion system membrane protein [Phycisphaerae bacterium]|nr:PorP/SprF family type IX secretion system membrane protein [Saprospiraceae bacterium]
MKILYTILFSSLAFTAFSQQLPLFTQYREYSGVINPASVPDDYLRYGKTLSFGASFRKQWVIAQDGPFTGMLRTDYLPQRKAVNPIFSAYLLNDKAGRMGMTGLYLRTAMLFSDSPLEYGLSAGLSVGIMQYRLDLSNPQVQDPTALEVYDKGSTYFPDAGLGVYGYTTLGNDHLLFGGLSMPQALSLDTRFRKDGKIIAIRRVRHFYGTVGYRIPQGDESSFLEVSTWVRYIAPLPPSLDFNFRWQFIENAFVGTGFSTNGNAHLEAGFNFGEKELFRIGMGADLPFTAISSYFGSSFEANVSYALDR